MNRFKQLVLTFYVFVSLKISRFRYIYVSHMNEKLF